MAKKKPPKPLKREEAAAAAAAEGEGADGEAPEKRKKLSSKVCAPRSCIGDSHNVVP